MLIMPVSKICLKRKIPQGYTEAVDMLKVTEANIPIDSDLTAFPFESRELYPFGLTTIVPLYGAGKRLGTIILARVENPLTRMI